MIKRLDRLDVATTDLAAAGTAYRNNFGFTVAADDAGVSATIRIGDAQILLETGASVADIIATSGEGLAAVWLEADDVEKMATDLQGAGILCAPLRREGDKRILAVDPKSANMVPLFIFDTKS